MANKKKYELENLNIDGVSIDEIILLDSIDLYRHAEFYNETKISLNDSMNPHLNWYTFKGMPVKYPKTK